jgi:hypothetical protein
MTDLQFETSDKVLNTFDIDKVATTTHITDMYQDGNFLVGTTDQGTVFRQHIPADKILNKNEKGEWVLETINLRA